MSQTNDLLKTHTNVLNEQNEQKKGCKTKRDDKIILDLVKKEVKINIDHQKQKLEALISQIQVFMDKYVASTKIVSHEMRSFQNKVS